VTTASKRYNLKLPEELYQELQTLAERRQTTVLELLRRFVKLGLLVAKAEESPDMAFILREGDKERELVLL
jgi:predicted transcriptional regulator